MAKHCLTKIAHSSSENRNNDEESVVGEIVNIWLASFNSVSYCSTVA